jgi:hypothetical protein
VFKRLAEAYAIPGPAVVVLAISGLLAFATVIGLATFSGLVALWPEMPFGVAVALAIAFPLVFVVGVGLVCAMHDKWASDPRKAKWLKVVKLVAPMALIAYLLFESVRPWL